MQHLVSTYGIVAVLLLMTAESACIPIPSELIMTFAGVLAALGKLNLFEAIAAGSVGNVIGSYIAWIVGRTGGRVAVLRFGKFIGLREDDLHRAERWFEKKGDLAVFLGRLLPVVRTFISLPAGIAEMDPLRFGIYTLLGSIPFTAALAVAGYALGSGYHSIVKLVQYGGYAIAAVVMVAIIVFFAKRFTSGRQVGETG